jgi:arabinosaccharide transport system substrate-binding protein
MRSFPFGSAALAILILSLMSGFWLLFHPASAKTATLTVWVFSKEHKENYDKAIPAFEKSHPGKTVQIQLVSNNALATRLQAAFLADVDVPDLVEIEISSAGSFFRGPLERVGFLDLTDRIHKGGLYDKLVHARLAPYTKKGHIFGLPHDVHPVMLVYNREAFEQEHIDVNKIETWDDFIREGRRVTRTTGPNPQYMIELLDNNTQSFEPLMFQRGGGYFDPQGNCIFDNEAAVQTMIWYTPLVAGPKPIGNSLSSGLNIALAVKGRYFLTIISPDWRTKTFEKDIAHMSGKMALMPLPAATKGGPRTSTWGGTMMGIAKKCPNPDLAWELAQHLYLNKADLARRFEASNILPATSAAWSDPSFDTPRPYWSGQPLGRLYANLAPQVPFQYSSPFIQVAKDKVGEAVVACSQRYRAQGDRDFEKFVRETLTAKANEVRKLIERNPY